MGGQVQRDAIDAFRPTFIVSMHEGPQEGFFMFAEGKLEQQLIDAISRELTSAGAGLAQKNFFGITLRRGIWQKPIAIFALQRLLGIHTLGSYAHAKKIPMITTESPWSETDVEARKRAHVAVVRGVVSVLRKSLT